MGTKQIGRICLYNKQTGEVRGFFYTDHYENEEKLMNSLRYHANKIKIGDFRDVIYEFDVIDSETYEIVENSLYHQYFVFKDFKAAYKKHTAVYAK